MRLRQIDRQRQRETVTNRQADRQTDRQTQYDHNANFFFLK